MGYGRIGQETMLVNKLKIEQFCSICGKSVGTGYKTITKKVCYSCKRASINRRQIEYRTTPESKEKQEQYYKNARDKKIREGKIIPRYSRTALNASFNCLKCGKLVYEKERYCTRKLCEVCAKEAINKYNKETKFSDHNVKRLLLYNGIAEKDITSEMLDTRRQEKIKQSKLKQDRANNIVVCKECGKPVTKVYCHMYLCNDCANKRGRKYAKVYNTNNKQKVRERSRRTAEQLPDAYIKRRLIRDGFAVESIAPDIIRLRRQLLMGRRHILKLNKEEKENGSDYINASKQ